MFCGWCNIPNKKHFNPTEQMIVAYHKAQQTIVHPCKRIYIDNDWTSGVLVDFNKIVDTCTNKASQTDQPELSINNDQGLSFDKKVHITIFIFVIQLLEPLIHLVIVYGVIALILQHLTHSKLWQFLFVEVEEENFKNEQ